MGSDSNILKRIYRCAKAYEAEWIVRVWGDCPLLEPDSINTMLHRAIIKNQGYTYNSGSKGKTVSIFPFRALDILNNCLNKHERYRYNEIDEHSVWRTYFGNIKVEQPDDGIDYSVDTQEDLDRIRELWAK